VVGGFVVGGGGIRGGGCRILGLLGGRWHGDVAELDFFLGRENVVGVWAAVECWARPGEGRGVEVLSREFCERRCDEGAWGLEEGLFGDGVFAEDGGVGDVICVSYAAALVFQSAHARRCGLEFEFGEEVGGW